MSHKNWEIIWNKREILSDQNLTLENLIALDGFDSGAGKINLNSWREYAKKLSELLALKNGESLFEVGCGSGALLYAILEVKRGIKVAGIDYGMSLIEAAKKAIPEGSFECINAKNLQKDPKFDHLISNSLFQYLSLGEAKQVVEAMIQKSKKNIYILDIPSLEKKSLSEKIRKLSLNQDEYEKKYEGLSHSYYEKEWFFEICKSFDKSLSCEFLEGIIPNYAQNQYRFNCLIRKT